MRYCSTKTYGHEVGFSCAFRQWRAGSHCNLIHGYALAFKFVFETTQLDDRNWVVDFGGLKGLKEELAKHFDHTTVVAADDPQLRWFQEAEARGILRLVVLPATGCEKFADFALRLANIWLDKNKLTNVRVRSVEVMEHGANSALVEPFYTGGVVGPARTAIAGLRAL